MQKLIELLIRRRVLVSACFVLIAAFGVYSWTRLPVDAYPDIADVTVQVVTQVPGLAAEEIEQQITIPIERELNGMPGLHTMRSKNMFGVSTILLVFDDGTDDYWARQRTRERIGDVDLPFGAQPELNPLTSPTGEVCRYILESKSYSLRELTDLQKWVVIPRLKQVTGVADVSNFGGITTQFQIEIDPRKLQKYDISLSEVIDQIGKNSSNAGGSFITRGDLSYVVRGIGLIKNLEDLGKVVVKTHNGFPVYLDDLGELKYGNLERKGILSFVDRERNDKDGVEGIVQLLRYQNPSEVLDGVSQAIDELNNDILPKGVQVHVFMDRRNLVSATLHTVSHTLLFGFLLVLTVLIVFLGSWRGALLVAITIPLALLFAFILMHLTDIPANLLSLGAIDFGIIVEGSVIMMETILKKREDHPEEYLQVGNIGKRSLAVARPIFFSILIIIMAYLPLFAFERVEKKMFTPMAYTIGFALVGAMLVALVLIPGLAFGAYRKPRRMYENKWLKRLTVLYGSRTAKMLNKPKRVIIPLILVVFATAILSMTVGKDFLPTLDEGSLWLQVQLPPGISLDKSKEMADTLRTHLMKYDEITYVMTQVGRDDEGVDPFSTSHVECSIGLKPYQDWPRGKRKTDLIAEVAEDLSHLPGYQVGFSQPIIDMVMDQAIKIYGEDLAGSRRIAGEIAGVIREIPGAADVNIEQEPPMPQLQILADREKISHYGLNVADVSELIEVAIGGKAISQVFIGNRVYEVICRYNEMYRNTPEAIGGLMLTSASGASIPLSQIAEIKTTLGPSIINREENHRFLTVRVNLRGRDMTSFMSEARERIKDRVKYDSNRFRIHWGGQFDSQRRAYARLAVIVPLALALMFLLLFGAFGILRQAGFLIALLPLSLFGGMLALNVTGMTFNVSSAVGFIALFGVFIQNGVVMMARINNLRNKGMELKEAVLSGSVQVLRPVLITASVAIIGLVPASLSTHIGSDVQRPLATVIVYGLAFGTLITIYALPALYYLIERKYDHPSVTQNVE
jgi:cobalt-zinc-cadmium resistance protein CzcA